MKTRAAVLYQLNKPLVIEDLQIPRLKKGQVLVRILWSGVCRAQYNEMIGLKGPDKFLPHCLGHEAAGEVVDTGAGITRVKAGDYVTLSWIKGPGLDGIRCAYRLGSKIINAGGVTTFSDYSVVSENRVTRISRQIPAQCAALLGCAVATGGGIVNNTLNVPRGSSLAVFGVGGVGLSAILCAKARGCRTIIAVDIHPAKLAMARQLGATHGVLAHRPTAYAQIRKIVPDGPDFAIDASGVKTAMELAFESLHPKGTLVIAGNLGKDERISLHPFELIKGKRILGTWGGETDPQRDLPRYGRAFLDGKLPIAKLITHRFSLEQINQAFTALQDARAGRILVRCAA